jgi:hypothetical protein
MSARFIDRLPCERNGTGLLLEPSDDVDGIAAHDVRIRQSRTLPVWSTPPLPAGSSSV